MLPDGCLIHLGRKDFETKLRRSRIDIAEIEGALLEVDNINESVVMLREDRPGDQRLVAYISFRRLTLLLRVPQSGVRLVKHCLST